MKSLLYVSRRSDDVGSYPSDVEAIVATSRIRNAELGITGVLVATPRHFAQILEGEGSAVDQIMASVSRDIRHYDIMIGPIEYRAKREYDRWDLAYHGESSYVSDLVARAIEAPDFAVAHHDLTLRSLMAMLALTVRA